MRSYFEFIEHKNKFSLISNSSMINENVFDEEEFNRIDELWGFGKRVPTPSYDLDLISKDVGSRSAGYDSSSNPFKDKPYEPRPKPKPSYDLNAIASDIQARERQKELSAKPNTNNIQKQIEILRDHLRKNGINDSKYSDETMKRTIFKILSFPKNIQKEKVKEMIAMLKSKSLGQPVSRGQVGIGQVGSTGTKLDSGGDQSGSVGLQQRGMPTYMAGKGQSGGDYTFSPNPSDTSKMLSMGSGFNTDGAGGSLMGNTSTRLSPEQIALYQQRMSGKGKIAPVADTGSGTGSTMSFGNDKMSYNPEIGSSSNQLTSFNSPSEATPRSLDGIERQTASSPSSGSGLSPEQKAAYYKRVGLNPDGSANRPMPVADTVPPEQNIIRSTDNPFAANVTYARRAAMRKW